MVILLTDITVEKSKVDGRKLVQVREVMTIATNGTFNCPSPRNSPEAGETEFVIAWKNPEPMELLRADRTFSRYGSSGHFCIICFSQPDPQKHIGVIFDSVRNVVRVRFRNWSSPR